MLQFIFSLVLLSLANLVSGIEGAASLVHLGGYQEGCVFTSLTRKDYSRIILEKPTRVSSVQLDMRSIFNATSLHYIVSVDNKVCGESLQTKQVQEFSVDCEGDGIIGSVITWSTKVAPNDNFMFCGFNAYGVYDGAIPTSSTAAPSPTTVSPVAKKIDLSGSKTKQDSTSPQHPASNAIDGNHNTYSKTLPGPSGTNWWTVDLGSDYTITSVKLMGHDVPSEIVKVTVDGKACGTTTLEFGKLTTLDCSPQPNGRFLMVRLENKKQDDLTLSNVEVFGYQDCEPSHNLYKPVTV